MLSEHRAQSWLLRTCVLTHTNVDSHNAQTLTQKLGSKSSHRRNIVYSKYYEHDNKNTTSLVGRIAVKHVIDKIPYLYPTIKTNV